MSATRSVIQILTVLKMDGRTYIKILVYEIFALNNVLLNFMLD